MPDKRRLFLIGRNAKIWKDLKDHDALKAVAVTAYSHRDIATCDDLSAAPVWILSYSKDESENKALFEVLKNRGAVDVIYVSTATANVDNVTSCYTYPRVKRQAEKDAASILNAKIVRIGIVYSSPTELPGGATAATSYDSLAQQMAFFDFQKAPPIMLLFEKYVGLFGSKFEHLGYRIYGGLLAATGRWPCLLRPLDVLCRAVGWRWYGYLYVSNRLWFSTTSS